MKFIDFSHSKCYFNTGLLIHLITFCTAGVWRLTRIDIAQRKLMKRIEKYPEELNYTVFFYTNDINQI